jgi:hypothetical protein
MSAEILAEDGRRGAFSPAFDAAIAAGGARRKGAGKQTKGTTTGANPGRKPILPPAAGGQGAGYGMASRWFHRSPNRGKGGRAKHRTGREKDTRTIPSPTCRMEGQPEAAGVVFAREMQFYTAPKERAGACGLGVDPGEYYFSVR